MERRGEASEVNERYYILDEWCRKFLEVDCWAALATIRFHSEDGKEVTESPEHDPTELGKRFCSIGHRLISYGQREKNNV